MNCFNHPQKPALGLCKHCNRGLCLECSSDEGFGLACKGRCEAEVKAVGQLIQKNQVAHAKTPAIYFRIAIFYCLIALFFIGFPFFFQVFPPEISYLLMGFGALTLLGALFNFFNALKIKRS